MNYAIFRVSEKKYKNIQEIKGFERHMERLQYTPNADTPYIYVGLIYISNFDH